MIRAAGKHHEGLLHGGDVRAVVSVHLGARHRQRAARFHHLAAGDKPGGGGGEEVDLVLARDERAAMHVALLLLEVIAKGQGDLHYCGSAGAFIEPGRLLDVYVNVNVARVALTAAAAELLAHALFEGGDLGELRLDVGTLL